jgi:hypothetical protein
MRILWERPGHLVSEIPRKNEGGSRGELVFEGTEKGYEK